MALDELCFLGVVGAKFRTEVMAGGRAPELHIAVAQRERLAAEFAAGGAAVDEIPAAREHGNLSAA